MRCAVFGLFFIAAPILAVAQGQPCAPPLRYAFDPYKPSDLAIVRQLGAGVLANAPLTALLQLDPYVPSEAQLLRQYGGALPVWPYAWYPIYPITAYPLDSRPVCASTPQTTVTSGHPPITTFAELLTVLEQTRASSSAASSGARSVSAAAAPIDRNTGVSIDFAGRTWVSAGRAVQFDDAAFVRVGERAGSPIFRRTGAKEEIIYVPIGTGVVAPFRATRR